VERQADDAFYVKSIAEESVYFQRGHWSAASTLPWGDEEESNRAVEDTFHFTNAAPHHATFNNTIWGNLEDYGQMRSHAQADGGDQEFDLQGQRSGVLWPRPKGPYKVAVEYWKVAVIQRTATAIAAAAL
jgi:endonuclease G